MITVVSRETFEVMKRIGENSRERNSSIFDSMIERKYEFTDISLTVYRQAADIDKFESANFGYVLKDGRLYRG